jgi:hypothetical protein
MDPQNVVYIYNARFPVLKRREVLTHTTTWMKPEDIMLKKTDGRGWRRKSSREKLVECC